MIWGLLSQRLAHGLCTVVPPRNPLGKGILGTGIDKTSPGCCYLISLDLLKQEETGVPETHLS